MVAVNLILKFSKLLIIPKKLDGKFTVTLPAVNPETVSEELVMVTWDSVKKIISPFFTEALGFASESGSRIVIRKLFSEKLTNLCVPNGNCAANVILPPLLVIVVIKSLLR